MGGVGDALADLVGELFDRPLLGWLRQRVYREGHRYPAATLVERVTGTPPNHRALVQALRGGGLVILVRHGVTFRDQADTDPLHPENIAAQRQLNDQGKAAAKGFGDALRQIGAPVGKVYTSQFNRAYETAASAGFKDIEKTVDLNEISQVASPSADRNATLFCS